MLTVEAQLRLLTSKMQLLVCALCVLVGVTMIQGSNHGQDAQGRPRGHRDNPRNRPPMRFMTGDSKMEDGQISVRLLRRGCGIEILRNFGDIEDQDLCEGGPGGSSEQRPTGPEGGGDGQEGPEDGDRSSPNGDDPPRNGDGPPPRDSDRSPRGDGDGDGDGPQTRSDEDPPSRSGEGSPSRSSNGSRSSGDDDCFRARMTRPVVWFPDYVGAGDDEGNELADDSICPPINFRDLVCTVEVAADDVTVPDTEDVMAKQATITGDLGEGQTFTMIAYLIKSNGTVGTEARELYRGMLKFSIEVSGVPACDAAGSSRLGLRLESRCPPTRERNNVEGDDDEGPPGDGGPPRRRPSRLNLCGGAEAVLSEEVTVDEGIQQLLQEPTISADGRISIAIPRGSRFFYDPETDPGYELYEDPEDENDDGNEPNDNGSGMAMTSLVAMAAAFLVTLCF